MIPVEKVHELVIGSADTPDHPKHIAAASSMVRHAHDLFIVADDEYSLAIFPAERREPGHLIKILEGHPPRDQNERKKEKPDLESLALLPATDGLPNGALLALGSGSSDKRNLGALIPLGGDGDPHETHARVDMTPLYERLKNGLMLNIEGSVVVDDTLYLLQRGNNARRDNAIVAIELDRFVSALVAEEPPPPETVAWVDRVDLGRHRGVDLSFSDASALGDGRVVFSASAEDSGDDGGDGKTYGSALGVMSTSGEIEMLEPVDLEVKIEGIDAHVSDHGIDVLIVTDADDPNNPSPLLKATIGTEPTLLS